MQEEEPGSEILQKIVSSYQNRTLAEEVKDLAKMGTDIDWVLKLIDTDYAQGIDNSP